MTSTVKPVLILPYASYSPLTKERYKPGAHEAFSPLERKQLTADELKTLRERSTTPKLHRTISSRNLNGQAIHESNPPPIIPSSFEAIKELQKRLINGDIKK